VRYAFDIGFNLVYYYVCIVAVVFRLTYFCLAHVAVVGNLIEKILIPLLRLLYYCTIYMEMVKYIILISRRIGMMKLSLIMNNIMFLQLKT